MDCLRYLLPKGYPRAPPSSPQSSPASVATARSSESDDSDNSSPPTPDHEDHGLDPSLPYEIDEVEFSDHLSPPRLQHDDDELPPFVSDKEDHTSLDQMEGRTPKRDTDQPPRLYKHRSAASSTEETQTRSRSDPSTPHPEKDRTKRAIHMRRSSMPASALRRLSKPHNTPKVDSPSVRFSVDDQHTESTDGVYAGIAPDVHDESNLTDFSNWNIGYEDEGLGLEDRSGAATSVDSPKSKGIKAALRNLFCSNDDDTTDEDDDIFNETTDSKQRLISRSSNDSIKAHKLQRADSYPSLAIPLEIRLRRASVSDPMNAHRKSLPAAKVFQTGQRSTTTWRRRTAESPPKIVPPKSSSAGSALTHAYVHMFLLGEGDGLASADAEATRKISSTFQVVRSKNSIYEVIWEDELAYPIKQSAALTSSLSSSSSASPDSFTPYRPSHMAADARDSSLEPIDTKLAAWSWDNGRKSSHVPRHENAPARPLTPSRSSEKLPSRHVDDGLVGSKSHAPPVSFTHKEEASDPRECSVKCTTGSEGPEERVLDPMEIDKIVNRERSSSSNSSMPSSSRLPTSSPRKASPTIGPILTLPRQALNAKQRRDLLGNRKVSNLPSEGDHFALLPRDSLILARKRIFHDASDQDQTASLGSDPHIEELKRTTRSLSNPEIDLDLASVAKHDEDNTPTQILPLAGNSIDLLNSSTEEGGNARDVESAHGKRRHEFREYSSKDAGSNGRVDRETKHLLRSVVHD